MVPRCPVCNERLKGDELMMQIVPAPLTDKLYIIKSTYNVVRDFAQDIEDDFTSSWMLLKL